MTRTPKPAPNDPRVAAIQRAQEKLRKKRLPKKTSTYREGSIRQTQGEQAEADAATWLNDEFTCAGKAWTVLMWQEAKKELFGIGPFDRGGEWEAIRNSQNGDLYVYEDPKGLWSDPTLLFSVEVKSSQQWPNATITYSELSESRAEYLLAMTTVGTWICTMDEARKKCRECNTSRDNGGIYYIVPHDLVKTVTIKEIIDAEEKRREPWVPPPGYEYDVPF